MRLLVVEELRPSFHTSRGQVNPESRIHAACSVAELNISTCIYNIYIYIYQLFIARVLELLYVNYLDVFEGIFKLECVLYNCHICIYMYLRCIDMLNMLNIATLNP